jgi:hypothetical protein
MSPYSIIIGAGGGLDPPANSIATLPFRGSSNKLETKRCTLYQERYLGWELQFPWWEQRGPWLDVPATAAAAHELMV